VHEIRYNGYFPESLRAMATVGTSSRRGGRAISAIIEALRSLCEMGLHSGASDVMV
jgi:hypothetical protein